jgi:hypothetical protein
MRGHGRWNTRLTNFKFTSCLRIVPRNALVLTGLANFRVVRKPEVIRLFPGGP